MRQNGEVKAL